MAMSKVILVPHPGPEPDVKAPGPVPWNQGDHRRKFLSAKGWYVSTPSGPKLPSDLLFWGEYEPPTIATRTLRPRPGGARYVHSIANVGKQQPGSNAAGICMGGAPVPCPQNTDPWLWHDGFTWTICRHRGRGNRLRPLIRNWSESAIVLFGSVIQGQWALDTVLVAPGSQNSAATLGQLRSKFDVPYQRLVLDYLGSFPLLRPIRGTGFVSPGVMRTFSFVPATTDPSNVFPRPNVGHIFGRWLRKRNGLPPSPTSSRQLTECSIKGTAQDFWDALVLEVTQNQLVLAVAFDTPLGWAGLDVNGARP